MRHIYEIGSNILCFEPDERKEKIIYEARIISHNGHDYDNKKLVPFYLVHFLGWKKKYDRVVSQDLLLPRNDFYLNLKAKIDEIAKSEKKNSIRHDLVDEVLEVASRVVDDIEFDWNTIDDTVKKLRKSIKQQMEGDPSVHDVKSVVDLDTWKYQSFEKPSSDNFDAISDGEKSLFSKENDIIHMLFSPKINLTENQLNILELDHKRCCSKVSHFQINRMDDIHKYARKPCVVDILQMYMDFVPHCDYRVPGWKEFERFNDLEVDSDSITPADISTGTFLDLCNDSVSNRRHPKLPQWPDSELNANYQKADVSTQLCFEICSGLRVLFDFYARSCLLYENEWPVHDAMVALCAVGSDQERLRPVSMDNRLELVPSQFRHHRFGFQPSLHYGYPHLLRLLHEMPRILTRMCLTRASLAVILRHLYCLVRYLDAHLGDEAAPLPGKPAGKRGRPDAGGPRRASARLCKA